RLRAKYDRVYFARGIPWFVGRGQSHFLPSHRACPSQLIVTSGCEPLLLCSREIVEPVAARRIRQRIIDKDRGEIKVHLVAVEIGSHVLKAKRFGRSRKKRPKHRLTKTIDLAVVWIGNIRRYLSD